MSLSPHASRRLYSSKTALMDPENSWKGAASLPVGVTGAGSNASPQASLRVREPYFGPSLVSMSLPKALKDKLKCSASSSRSTVSLFCTALTELRCAKRYVSD
jgi:hypothetical protein